MQRLIDGPVLTVILGVFLFLGTMAPMLQADAATGAIPFSSEASGTGGDCTPCADGDLETAAPAGCFPACPAWSGVIDALGLQEYPRPGSALAGPDKHFLAGWLTAPDPYPPKTATLG